MDVNNPPSIPEVFASIGGTVQQVLFGLGPVLLVLMIVYAGYIRLTAADNPKKVQQSTQTIMWAIVGYLVVLGSFFLIRIIAEILGYPLGGSITVDL